MIDENEKQNPTWADIQAGLHLIKHSKANTLILQGPGGELPWLTVGGTFDDKFSLSIELQPAKAYLLKYVAADAQETNVIFPFGECTTIPRYRLIPFDALLQAVRYYVRYAKPDPSLVWEKWPDDLLSNGR